jgi:hypothetical protein
VVDFVIRYREPCAVKPFHPTGLPQDVECSGVVVVDLVVSDKLVIAVATKPDLRIVMESISDYLATGRL